MRSARGPILRRMKFALAFLLALPLFAQIQPGPFARIAVLRPHDGDTVDFEAGYIRHLDWHRRNEDPFTWFGWTIWAGERQRWFVYATFGHASGDFDKAVNPADDERDNIANVTPHAQFVANGLYEFLPALSRGNPQPTASARLEFTTVELLPGREKAFESALAAQREHLADETLWFRMIAGGAAPRYVRLRPRATILGAEQLLPDGAARVTVEILTLRPAMSYRLP